MAVTIFIIQVSLDLVADNLWLLSCLIVEFKFLFSVLVLLCGASIDRSSRKLILVHLKWLIAFTGFDLPVTISRIRRFHLF